LPCSKIAAPSRLLICIESWPLGVAVQNFPFSLSGSSGAWTALRLTTTP
jgi:hypothetical protein